ncbi:MAG: hypothetical protein WD116_03535 [Chloroflexota bacterium]
MVLIAVVLFGTLAWWITGSLQLEWWIGVLIYLVVPIPLMAGVGKSIEQREAVKEAFKERSADESAAVILAGGSAEAHAARIREAYVHADEAGRTRDADTMLQVLKVIRQEAEQGGYVDVASAASVACTGIMADDERAFVRGVTELNRAVYALK